LPTPTIAILIFLMAKSERLRRLRNLGQGMSLGISQGEKARLGKKTSEFQKNRQIFLAGNFIEKIKIA
jgi:hypothetical protein